MYFDIAIAVILLVSMFFGFRKGFVYTFIHTIDWILALAAAFIWSPKLKDYLVEKTPIYKNMCTALNDKFADSLANSRISLDAVPGAIRDMIEALSESASTNLAEAIAEFLFSVLCFLAIVLAVKLVLWLILSVLSKKNNDGFTGFVDGLLGLIAGAVKGLIIVCILLAIMLPVLNFLSPDTIEAANKILQESMVAKYIYDNNIVVLIIKSFFK